VIGGASVGRYVLTGGAHNRASGWLSSGIPRTLSELPNPGSGWAPIDNLKYRYRKFSVVIEPAINYST